MKPVLRKWILRGLAVSAVFSILFWVLESLLEPKLRVVSFEDVPASSSAPDVTFMVGAVMNPPVSTNPFLQIFSPLETLTARLKMSEGSLVVMSDTHVLFVWEIFSRRSVWRLDRQAKEMIPLLVQPTGIPSNLCARLFPAFSALLRADRGMKIRASDVPNRIDLNAGTQWVEMEISENSRALWARRAKS